MPDAFAEAREGTRHQFQAGLQRGDQARSIGIRSRAPAGRGA
jgi:hypothetical protein